MGRYSYGRVLVCEAQILTAWEVFSTTFTDFRPGKFRIEGLAILSGAPYSAAPLTRQTGKRPVTADIVYIHPDNPQQRLLVQVAERIRAGAIVVYPTDSAYALGCHLGDKAAVDKIRRIRRLDKHHNFTLMCRDLSELGTYAKVDNQLFRQLKANTPGPYTLILQATSEVPRRLLHPKRKTIGLRVPDNAIAQGLLAELGEPLMSVTVIPPGNDKPLTDPEDIKDWLLQHVDVFVDGGYCGLEPTTVIDFSGDHPLLLRAGMGDPQVFGC